MLIRQFLTSARGWKAIVSILILVCYLSVGLFAQNTTVRITVSEDRITISKALKEVARQLNKGLSYDADILKDRVISLHLSNVTWQEALKNILSGTGLEGALTKDG